ncbi:MAG: bactofilin family protein [bacterium]
MTDTVEQSLIGRGLTVFGDITCGENLSIRGAVEGNTLVPEGAVTIEPEGRVKGHVVANKIIVKGRVRGNLYADDIVIVRSSADVLGKIFASKVRLEDGGLYKGRINMEAKARRLAEARTRILRKP